MSLTKVNYIDNSTIITAQNLNDIQDNIIQNAELIKKASPRNLLDNSDWRVKELIVNQRGYTKWTRDAKPETGADATTQYGITNAGAYTVDRWKMFVDIGIINLVSNGIELDAISKAITFGQRFDDAVSNRMFASGKKYTVAVNYTVEVSGSNITLFQGLKDNAVNIIGVLDKTVGTHTAVFVFTPNGASGDNTYCPFHLYVQSGNKLTLHWAALYEGEYTAETLPEYQPKGYGAELAECQRYFYRIPAWGTIGVGCVDWNGTSLVIQTPIGVTMRKNPSITENITVYGRMEGFSGGFAVSGKTPSAGICGNTVTLTYTDYFSDTTYAYKPLFLVNADTPLDFNADL